ncbi:MAG: N-6 DNA methylase, partial [Armatimonadetes bacterium]|nr:N-6 DNA methylase [Armatimonadota bacterium]
LRDGTQKAIEILGGGFLAHANNKGLRADLEAGNLSREDFYRFTLRIVYRMLFVLVAESKDALLLPTASDGEKALYQKFFSLSKLKERALKRRGDDYFDLWRGLKITFGALRCGEPALAMPALGGFLFEPIPFDDCDISNRDLLAALRALGFFEDEKGNRVAVNFNLGSEELGSVYESLLELSPVLDVDARTFGFALLAGNERKTTGAYYTPEILVKSLLESALDPLIERALRSESPESALLSLSVLDPACGSGHFLTAAARRIAHHLALVRSGGDEPTTPQKRAAIRDVVSHCIYGVDLNPMAVELCKVALWMEALEPGKPLSFLDSHIRCGNALLGATPTLLDKGIPDDAFKPLEGDDRSVMVGLKKQNRAEAAGQTSLFDDDELTIYDGLFGAADSIERTPDDLLEQVNTKAKHYQSLRKSSTFEKLRRASDAWCAAFVWRRVRDTDPHYIAPVTTATVREIERTGNAPRTGQNEEIDRLGALYGWFHPTLEFPTVMGRGGFDLVMGNPPWEHTELKEKEWFATRKPEIANAPTGAIRKRMIDDLVESDPQLSTDFLDARRVHDASSHFASASGRYPLCGRGRINTYALFAEVNRSFINGRGRVGCIVPSGIATDDTTKAFFGAICDQKQLVSLFDIE